MKKLYNKKKRLIDELNKIGQELDRLIEDRWGFHYSQTDNDAIIDTLDYGTNTLDYIEFVSIMNDFEQSYKDGSWVPNY